MAMVRARAWARSRFMISHSGKFRVRVRFRAWVRNGFRVRLG